MRMRWLSTVGVLLLCLAGWCPGQETGSDPASKKSAGYLILPSPIVRTSNPPVAPYWPQPGDIVVYDNDSKLFHLMFKLASTSPPTHAAMVIARADGTPALLELAGARTATASVCIMDVEQRFKTYPGDVMVRRIRQPLTAEQSRDLTKFAESQVGKRFALWRCVLLGTPFCPRQGMRREYFGHTYASRHRWFCSELVVAAGASAGLFDGTRYPANATVPRDLAVDELMDLSSQYFPPAPWTATAPADKSGVQLTTGNR
ncbi:MAG TPA: hypothetical protein VFE62_01530 [Gemmataceae bacterium]|nr:hypothetical protein [Gemmataceae bacterium]